MAVPTGGHGGMVFESDLNLKNVKYCSLKHLIISYITVFDQKIPFNMISGPKIEKNRHFLAVVYNSNLAHDIVNILFCIVSELLRRLILSSTLYVRY